MGGPRAASRGRPLARLIHTAYVIELSGPSLRETRAKAARAAPNDTDQGGEEIPKPFWRHPAGHPRPGRRPLAKRILHAQRDERPLHGAHGASD